ncbi:MAG: ATP phosphoribosyltransferase regulatory subunit [Alphaproteobacteria bacterium]|nr:ATP phosphoribosyltransferase regulatory subunit [Alphaproteobacteria bacterium]
MTTLTGMPEYDTTTLQRLHAQDREIAAVFGRHGYGFVEPPILEPAEIFLEQSGEEIRRHIYVFNDPAGNELCLRPDLTIPTCRMFLRQNADAGRDPARLCYNGPAFRFQPQGREMPCQFQQAGVEFLGDPDRPGADAEVLALTVEALQAAGLTRFDVQIGDLGLFFALLDKLSLPPRWRDRLKHQFWRPAELRKLLARLSDNAGETASPGRAAFLEAIQSLDGAKARLALEEVLAMSGILTAGGRDSREIAERFLDQAEEAQAQGLSPEISDLIDAFLRIAGPPQDALAQIIALSASAGIDLREAEACFEKRLELLEKRGLPTDKFQYVAQFGRTLEYYTGFVFDLRAPDMGEYGLIAGGGRYDALLRRLGAPYDIPAIGSAIRTEWLLAACEAEK